MAKTSDIAEMPKLRSDIPCAVPALCADLADQVLMITDDLPLDAAISPAELDAVERYLSDILDAVLGKF